MKQKLLYKVDRIFLTPEEVDKLTQMEYEFNSVFWKVWHKKYLGPREEMINHLKKVKTLINEIISD